LLVTQCTSSGHTAIAPFAPEQRKVELAAFEIAGQILALVGADVEPQVRMRAREPAEQLCQPIRGKILGDAEPDRTLAIGLAQHVARFFRKRQQPPRIGEQALAGFSGAHVLAVTMQQHLTDILLQPLDLLADGGLRAVDALARAGKAAGIDHRDEAAQELQIEHGRLHSKIH
jgi:hypothetical protein